MPGVLLVGNGAREHAIAEAIMRSSLNPKLFSCMKTNNPGIAALSQNPSSGPTRIWRPSWPSRRRTAASSLSSGRKTP